MAATTYPNYSPGLEGVIAGISKICDIDSDKSLLIYRGYNVQDLAEYGSFEETAYLLLHGDLPTAAQLETFKETLRGERGVPSEIYTVLRAMPRDTHPMDLAKVAFAALAPHDPDYTNGDHDANVRKATRIVAKAPTLVAAAHRIRTGKDPIEPSSSLGHAANFLYMMEGSEPDDYTAKVMDASLTLYAEHGFNASAFACRVTVATLSDLYSGIVSGIGTLKGPLHGGANEEAMRMLIEIGDPANAEHWIRDALAQKKKVMGFGHREYKKGDSRAMYLTRIAKDIGQRKGNTKWGEVADILERVMLDEKNLHPNVDFPAAYAYYLLGIPIDLYTPIFVIARVSGWSAHAIEQLDNNRLIRPTCIYEGSGLRDWVALGDRS